ncbi:MAG: ADP-ribosylation factor-like protein [Candidatus Hodarchaeota archaeon]
MSKKSCKIGVFGLDESGKTSFLRTLDRKYSFIVNPKPTKGIERSSLEILSETVVIWDYGGQETYRQRYLTSDTDLKDLAFAFFLVDIQDSGRFDIAAAFFEDILEKADDLEESRIAVCLHKADPDLFGTSELQGNISQGSAIFGDVFPDATPFFLTSIYLESSLRRSFSFGLQKTRHDRGRIGEGLEKILRKTGGLAAALLNPQPLVIGSAALHPEYLEGCEELGFTLANGWNRAVRNLSKLKYQVAKVEDGEILFLPAQMGDQQVFLLTYAPRLPENSIMGWLAACADELNQLGIQIE